MNDSFTSLRSVHFVGIKGVAMTALAIYCKERGMRVTGSDVTEEFPTQDALAQAGIIPLEGFTADHIGAGGKPDLVIFTGAHGGKDNPEVVAAEALGIQTLPHGRALGMMMEGSVQISVAGSHGKTTTTAMIATILMTAGRDPSFAVGCGSIRDIGLPGHYGKGTEFVAEADEYVTDPSHDRTPRFLWHHPHILVATNIDFDHPDAYKSIADVQVAFVKLQQQMEGPRITVVNADDPNSTVLAEGKNVVRFGFTDAADLLVSDVRYEPGRTAFSVSYKGTDMGVFHLAVPGACNVANAAAAIAAAAELDVPWETIRQALAQFKGTKRRFEYVGSVRGMDIYDDYAHHPHEIAASIEGIRAWFPQRRLVTVFQPHTFSRTKALLTEFAGAFGQSDIILIPDIYASARESKSTEITAQHLVDAIAVHGKDARYVKDLDGTLEFLKTHGRDKDILVFMGAGDIYEWSRDMLSRLN